MAWITWFLFESPLALAIPALLIGYALLVRWRRGRSARPLLACVGVSAALLVTQALVVTDREAACSTLDGIGQDLRLSRVDALRAALSDRFLADDMTAEGFVERARQALQQIRITELSRWNLEVEESSASGFTVRATYFSRLVPRDGLEHPTKTHWRIWFVRSAAGPKIARVLPLELNGNAVSSFSDLN
ncbi:MAG: hypothetical protein CHACPFDD_03915 [Phycisphaerae bacterium]|nr:hypothetical protein [Phycisphaerae bacterium]